MGNLLFQFAVGESSTSYYKRRLEKFGKHYRKFCFGEICTDDNQRIAIDESI